MTDRTCGSGTKSFFTFSARAMDLIRSAYQAQLLLMARSLDGLHVASANLTRCHTLVGSDVRQRALAQLAGLKLFP